MARLVKCLFFLLCLELSFARVPNFHMGRPKEGFLRPPADPHGIYQYTADETIIYSNIIQKVDHFNESLKDNWTQEYQYNSKFYNKDRPLAFLMIGGEGAIGGDGDKWIKNEDVSMMKWAAEFRAAAFQVEHRFYGKSRPYPEQTTENLKYLTVDQVLADLKEFINQMNQLYFPGVSPKWITFGGSYPGSLSAWFRATYPEMTIGAVSTSSAVNTRVDYYGYAVNTEKNYRGISAQCGDNIGAAFKNIMQRAYKSDDSRDRMVKEMNLCKPFIGDDSVTTARQLQYMFSNIYGIFQGINQYSGDNRNHRNDLGEGLPMACDYMTYANNDPTANLLNMTNWDNEMNENNCTDNDWPGFISLLKQTNYDNLGVASYRTWIWQTCTFLGYFQTTDGGNKGIFGSTIPLDFYVDQCLEIFGSDYTADSIFEAVAKNQEQFGGDKNYKGTKVVFPNGSIDPWVSLGKLTPNKDNDVDAFIIEGTAHCADMYPWRDSDLQSLKDGRKRIHDNLERWINDAFAQQQDTTTPKSAGQISLLLATGLLMAGVLYL
ncbi:unnamed protein product, partial [Mesorhabditis belari]|uniref:Serine protease n=1 Tax=Mesorhabditis belari TaxID=2138241 RepID=A0AAF3F358_9BILA